MTLISEERLCTYLSRVLDLSQELLAVVPERGAEAMSADDPLRVAFERLVHDLGSERGNDTYLDDESWNWIWEGKEEYNPIRIYGRLAWINLQLLELL